MLPRQLYAQSLGNPVFSFRPTWGALENLAIFIASIFNRLDTTRRRPVISLDLSHEQARDPY